MERQIIAVCGQKGVGKTVFSALLSRTLIDACIEPLLLIDADPSGGLASALGKKSAKTLAEFSEHLLSSHRNMETPEVAHDLEYLLLQALSEHKQYSLLSIGQPKKGYSYPAHELLQSSIDMLVSAFSFVLIDGEAGIEQINRGAMRRVDSIITVVDGSANSMEMLRQIAESAKSIPVLVVCNRLLGKDTGQLPKEVRLIGLIPENQTLGEFGCEKRSFWDLPSDNPALVAVRSVANRLGVFSVSV